jgi:hypothetical protein
VRHGILSIVLIVTFSSGIVGCGGGSSTPPPPPPPPPVNTQNFSFYVLGVALNDEGHDPYNIAGVISVATDGSGKVTAGVQDYSDGDDIASPEPKGDSILSGSLAMQTSGQGTLTLVTNNSKLGVGGTETFAVAFSNANHALISQFDGSATSSGSLDLQTSTALPSGAFSFVASGSGANTEAVVEGGVFSVDGSGNITGVGDLNDGGDVTRGTPIPAGAMLSTPDSFGRGTVTTDTILFGTVNYYTVSPKVFRMVETELGATAVGTAYSQGANPSFANSAIGASAFSLGEGFDFYAAAGQLTTDAPADARNRSGSASSEVAATNNFSGTGDLNDLSGSLLPAAHITGTYTLAANGYGTMTFNAIDSSPGFGDVVTLGLYAVDPTINILDPNSSTNAGGGVLLAEMDANLAGTGVLIPQTDTTLSDFTGAYTFGAGGLTGAPAGFDFLGEATVTAGAFSGTGAVSDPFGALTSTAGEFPTVTFAATAAADADNAGRFTFEPLALSGTGLTSPVDTTFTAYQTNAGQVFVVQMDSTIESHGSIQQNTLKPAAGVRPAKRINPEH